MAIRDFYLVVIEIDEGTSFFNLANELLLKLYPDVDLGSGQGVN